MKTILTLGILEPAISDQLAGRLSKEDAQMLDLDHDAINRCYVRGLVGDGETTRARHRLIKKIKEALRRHAASMAKPSPVSQTPA